MIGAIIKKHRLDQNLSQASLCEGICAVSYLSKIETGHVNANKEIIDLLLNRLGLEMSKVSDKLESKIDDLFTEAYYGRFDEMHHIYKELKAFSYDLANSSLAVKWYFLVSEVASEERNLSLLDESLDLLSSYSPYFEADDFYYYYYFLGMRSYINGHLKEAYDFFSKSANYLRKGRSVFRMQMMDFLLGDYVNAIRLGQEANQLLMQEGNLYYMIDSLQLLAAAYSNAKQVETAMDLYNRLLQMGLYLKRDDILYGAYYNIGATYLAIKDYDNALIHLKKVLPFLNELNQWHIFVTYQKLILTYIGLCDFDEARALLDKVDKTFETVNFEDEILIKSFEWLMFFKNSDSPYNDPDYLQAIKATYEASSKGKHHGYTLFFGKYYIEALKAGRKYKEALEIEEKL
ncbi:helix-turn-helix transcriptional regulator [Acidaminobacter sp. JC074]|uniref:helix-turn-helix domain-containing protein n=1 Tax=Acidaminobacter sp. JC074 TaxID=2530199 RepID=UPI001F0D4D7E|nr:helix-turn-helix transcriptional regulator [Acidaminobacter sp. JC074]MCH4887024.1 helix-turn-helix transcriptional regulator [Acidaminobacter sp. JC074]